MADNSHGGFSRWMQHKMNARMNRKIRNGKGTFMGMNVLILNTVGRRSGTPRQTPISWFPGGEDTWLLVASGGKNGAPDWQRNLLAHPEQASIELPGESPRQVVPQVLTGAERAKAWDAITAEQPRYGKYQAKSEHEYAVVRLSSR
ncbi:nitroreductase family deazaflavin-dependent oxidoreductase [Nocardia asteroides]|uniref:nitroreductase family deazaflavin-dependent oxidoreductase n=1 Tax=Nocardia asteroides TaxID=1824 RepID=UPI001E5958BC|nr:nitroreductase family deazaflavin-dependent oxidoreductase [Nocardia asteroides]UGT56958.1 nitroreductase family deazaflavin-dependent oxidoreductase [Nocardia asteroides]